MPINAAARALLESRALAHLVTINPDGSPQVAIVWVGLDGDEIVSAHLDTNQKKLRNVRRDPRVALSLEAGTVSGQGLAHHLIIEGTARITEGGAAELLQELAHVYIGPDVRFPPMDDPPPGLVLRVSIDKVRGVGDWTE